MAAIIIKLRKVTYTYKMVRMRRRPPKTARIMATLTRKDLVKAKMKIRNQIPLQIQIKKKIKINKSKLIPKRTLALLDV